MDVRKSNQYRLLQIVLGHSGVYEVHGRVDSHDLVCNCPGFRHRGRCKHVRFVAERVDADGVFDMAVVGSSELTSDEVSALASKDPGAYRDWVIRRSRIEVL